jgi:CRP/FNR family transcriptional regulator, cyclic AMP receptor protein
MSGDLLASSAFDALRAAGHTRRYRRGESLMHERQVPDSIVVICAGHVKLTRGGGGQGKEVLLAIAGPGDLLGELSVIDHEPRSATATALEDVEALEVPASSFSRMLERRPDLSRHLMESMSRRLRDSGLMRAEFTALDSVGRVCARLAELGDRFGRPAGEGIRIEMPITQDELADWAACSQEATGKALRALRDLGWIETGRGEVTLNEPEELRRRAS